MYKAIFWLTTLAAITGFNIAPAQAISILWTGDDRLTQTNNPLRPQDNANGKRTAQSTFYNVDLGVNLTADTMSNTNRSSSNSIPPPSTAFIRSIRSFELFDEGPDLDNLTISSSLTGDMIGSVRAREVNNERTCKRTNRKSCYISSVKTKIFIADCKSSQCLEFSISNEATQVLNGKKPESSGRETKLIATTKRREIPELEFNKTYYLITELTATSQKVRNADTEVSSNLRVEFTGNIPVIPEPSFVLGLLLGGGWLGFCKRKIFKKRKKIKAG